MTATDDPKELEMDDTGHTAEAAVHPVDEMLPIPKLAALGLQHVLAMYAGAVTIPILIAKAAGLSGHDLAILVSLDLFTCGIATLIQAIGFPGFGIRMPVILGCTFAAIGPLVVVVKGAQAGGLDAHHAMTTIYGAIIVAGLMVVLLAPLYGKILRFFPTVVTGSVVTLIGVSLVPVAMKNMGGGPDMTAPGWGAPQNLGLAFLTVAVVVLSNRFFRGFLQAISVLTGIVVGTLVAIPMGVVKFEEVTQAKLVSVPQPFYFGLPRFDIPAIVMVCIVMITVMIESTGTFYGMGKVVGKDVSARDLVKGLRAEGLATTIGGIFNSFPYTTFNQNLGLVALSKVFSRWVVVASGIILMLLGLIPKFGALATIIPTPVIGGATIVMFAMVAVAGFKMLQAVNFDKMGNMMTVAVAIAMGLGVAEVPIFEQLPQTIWATWIRAILGSGIVMGSLCAVAMNMFFNWKELGREDFAQTRSQVDDSPVII